jgi:hypothetical protein
MLAYKLNINHQIDGNRLLQNIQELIQKSVVDADKEYILVIKVQNIGYDDNSAIPKLEYHHVDQSSV